MKGADYFQTHLLGIFHICMILTNFAAKLVEFPGGWSTYLIQLNIMEIAVCKEYFACTVCRAIHHIQPKI